MVRIWSEIQCRNIIDTRFSMQCLWAMHHWRKTAAISLAAVLVSHALVPNEVTCKIRAAKLARHEWKTAYSAKIRFPFYALTLNWEGTNRRALVRLSVLVFVRTLLKDMSCVTKKVKAYQGMLTPPKFKVICHTWGSMVNYYYVGSFVKMDTYLAYVYVANQSQITMIIFSVFP